jgi:hypothetical protein
MRTRKGEDVIEQEQLEQIQKEEQNWHAAYGANSARVTTLCGRPALIMRYLRPLELQDGTLTPEDRSAVETAIEKFAAKGLKQEDLALRHIGVLSPPNKNRKKGGGSEVEVVIFDLGQVSKEENSAVAIADMMAQMSFL